MKPELIRLAPLHQHEKLMETFEPGHEIFNNVVFATSKASDQPAHTRSLTRAFASRLTKSVKLLTEHHLEFLSLKVGCTSSSESTLVNMPHCWKSHVTAHLLSVPTSHVLIKSSFQLFINEPQHVPSNNVSFRQL